MKASLKPSNLNIFYIISLEIDCIDVLNIFVSNIKLVHNGFNFKINQSLNII